MAGVVQFSFIFWTSKTEKKEKNINEIKEKRKEKLNNGKRKK